MATVYDALRLLAAFGWRVHVQEGDYRILEHRTRPGLLAIHGKPSDLLSEAALTDILNKAGIEEETR